MGQKTHPIGFRLNVRKSWNSMWFAEKNNFAESLEEDIKIRKYIAFRLPNAGISNVEINEEGETTTNSSIMHDIVRKFSIGKKINICPKPKQTSIN